MIDLIKKGGRSGFIFGIVLIFLMLFGLTTLLSEILGGLLNLGSNARVGNTGGLMLLFALLSLWAGYRAAAENKTEWKPSLISGASVGLVIGVITSIFVLIIGILDAADVEMRKYLVELNRPNVQFLLYGRNLTTGVLITFGIFLVFGLLGGLLAYVLEARQAGDLVQKRFIVWKEEALDSKIVNWYQENPRSNYRSRALPAPSTYDLREDHYETGDRHTPRRGAKPGDAGNVDDGMGNPAPEEELRAKQGRAVAYACDMRSEDQYRKQDEVFQHIAVSGCSPVRPAFQSRQALAVAREFG